MNVCIAMCRSLTKEDIIFNRSSYTVYIGEHLRYEMRYTYLDFDTYAAPIADATVTFVPTAYQSRCKMQELIIPDGYLTALATMKDILIWLESPENREEFHAVCSELLINYLQYSKVYYNAMYELNLKINKSIQSRLAISLPKYYSYAMDLSDIIERGTRKGHSYTPRFNKATKHQVQVTYVNDEVYPNMYNINLTHEEWYKIIGDIIEDKLIRQLT